MTVRRVGEIACAGGWVEQGVPGDFAHVQQNG
jgi:hypothetical protein